MFINIRVSVGAGILKNSDSNLSTIQAKVNACVASLSPCFV
jgi:hypothetical protein